MSQRSKVWLHFKKTSQGGLCKYCNSAVKTSGNTTNLKNHLKRRHPNIMIMIWFFEIEDSNSEESESEVSASTASISSCSNTNYQMVQPTISSCVLNLNSIKLRKLTERHDASYLGEPLKKICLEWETDDNKIICVTTDNAPNIVKAVKDTFGENKHLGCLAHTVNLIANKPFDEKEGVEEIRGVINLIKDIVTFFKHSVVAADDLRKEQTNEETSLKLIQSVATRWNSTYYQLERFYILANKVASVLLRHSRAPAMLNAYQLEVVEDLLKVFKPVERFSKDISGENYSSGSLVIPLVNCLTNAIEKINPKTTEGDKTKSVILFEITKRFYNIENIDVLSISTVLDPRFKKIHFQNSISCAHAIKRLKQLLSIAESQNSSICVDEPEEVDDSLWNYHKKLVEKSNSQNSTNIGSD